MDINNITPALIVQYLNYLVFGILIIGFLIGLVRGTFKATFRFGISLLVILGGWLVFPAVFKALVPYDFSSIYTFTTEVNGTNQTFTSIAEILEFATSQFVVVPEGTAINTTLTYELLYSVLQMLFGLVFILILLVLNFTIFRMLFGIIYLIIRPKKKDKNGNKRKKSWLSRLGGGAIGILNALFIIFLFCVPLAGVASMASDAGMFLNTTTSDDGQTIVNMSIGGEVVQLSDANLGNFDINQLSEWASIYRDSFAGQVFSMKIGGTEIDNSTFDDVFKIGITVDGEKKKVMIRKEIAIVAEAASIIYDDVIDPMIKNDMQFTPEMLDNIDANEIAQVFDKLSELDIVSVVVPVGIEIIPGFISKNSESLPDYIDVNEILNELQEVNYSNLISEIGDVAAALFDCVTDTVEKPSDLFGEGDIMANVMNNLLDIDETKVTTLFNAIANIQLLDAIQSVALGALDETEGLNSFLLLKPKLSISEDGYLEIDGVLTTILSSDDDFDSYTYALDENGNWIINGVTTSVSGANNQMSLNFNDVKLSDEIRNLGSIYSAFKSLGISSISGLQELITNGSSEEFSLDLFTEENIGNLFDAIFNSKIISGNIDNVYVVANNLIPNELRGTITETKITSTDLTSIVMAVKVVVDSGLYAKIKNSEEIDYVTLVTDYGDDLIDALLTSNVIADNITKVGNAAIKMVLGSQVFEIPETMNWRENGKTELKSLLNVASTVLNYKDKIQNDWTSLTDEELDEIFNCLIDNISASEIVKGNMNNLIDYVNTLEGFSNTGFVLKALASDDDWTQEELKSILEAVKIIVNLVKPEEGKEINFLVSLLKIKEEDINKILASDFLTSNIVANLYVLAGEGGQLAGYLTINIEEDDDSWPSELRIILTNAIKLVDGIESFDSENNSDMVNKLISNISKLSNDLGGIDDEVGEILSSVVLRDTLISLIKTLPEKTSDLVVINDTEEDPIQWLDSDETEGELRILLGVVQKLLIDDNGNVVLDKLTGEDSTTEDKVQLFLDIDNDDIDSILNSKILIDTLKEFIIKYSEDSEEDDAIIYLKDKDMSTNNWRIEIKAIIKAAKLLLVEEIVDSVTGEVTKKVNLDKFTSGTTEDMLDLLSDIDDADIDTIVASNILVDTIANMLIKLADQDNPFMVVPVEYRPNSEGIWDTDQWRSEISRVIKSAKTLLIDENGKNMSSQLLSGDTNDLLSVILELDTKDKINTVLNSDIIYETIKYQVKKMSDSDGTTDAIIQMPDDIDDWTREAWATELDAVIYAVDKLLVETSIDPVTNEEVKTVNIDKLSGSDINELLQLIVDLTDDELDKVLESKIISQTIAYQIEKVGEGDDNLIVTTSTTEYDLVAWQAEIKRIIKAVKLILVDDETNKVDLDKINSSDTNALLELIINLTDDEINEVMASVVITDTISKNIKSFGDGDNPTLIISDIVKAYSTTEWRVEIIALIKAAKLVIAEDDGSGNLTADIDKISGNVNIVLNNIVSLNDDPNGSNDELGIALSSVIINDTIVNQIEKQGQGDSAVLVVSDDIIWNDTYEGSTITSVGELRKIFRSLKLMFTTESIIEGVTVKTINIDINNLDVNTILNNIKGLNNNPNGINDELGEFLESQVICETVIDKIIDQGESGNLIVNYTTDSTEWYDRTDASNNFVNGELRNLLFSIKLLFGSEDIDINNIDTNNIMTNIKLLNNNPNGINDEVGQLISSLILHDTIIDKITEFGNGDNPTLVINEASFNWDDAYDISNNFISGELRNILVAIGVLFAGDVNMDSIDANIILDLNTENDDIDKVLTSKILYDTIEKRLYELDGKNEVVVNPIVDLTKEVKALINCANIILSTTDPITGEKVVDLNNPDFDVEKILNLTNDEQDKVLASNILVDTIKEKLIDLGNGDGAILVVQDDKIIDWKQEIKYIISDSKLILKADADGKYLTNPTVNYEGLYNLTDTEVSNLLLSIIIKDTIVIAICDQEDLDTTDVVQEVIDEYNSNNPDKLYNSLTDDEKDRVITDGTVWNDTYDADGNVISKGEIHRLLNSATELMDGDQFNIDYLLSDEINLDEVFNSRIVLDTFYTKVEELSTGADPVLFISSNTTLDKAEAINFVKSIKVVMGDKTISTISSTEFTFDKFINLTDDEINILLASNIIKYSASKKVLDITYGTGALSNYIELDIDFDGNDISSNTDDNYEKRLDMISNDLGNLIKVVRDLDKNCGISYNNFGFDTFKTAADTEVKADNISDTLVQSNLIVHSLKKLMENILSDSLSAEMMAVVELDINCNPSLADPTRNYWLDVVDGSGNVTEVGELKKIIRMLAYIDQFADSTNDNSSITDSTKLTTPLHAINDSIVLQGVVPLFADTALDNVSDWVYSPKPTLTKDEWDDEIDILGDLIVLINGDNGLSSMNNLDVKDSNFTTVTLSALLKLISKSRYLNISNIEVYIKSAVDSTFNGDYTVGSVNEGSTYESKVSAWDTEIDNLMTAVDNLRNVDSVDITSKTSDATYGTVGVKNATMVGKFLDSCNDSVILSPVVGDVYNSLTSSYSGLDIILTMAGLDPDHIESYETTLVVIATYLSA